MMGSLTPSTDPPACACPHADRDVRKGDRLLFHGRLHAPSSYMKPRSLTFLVFEPVATRCGSQVTQGRGPDTSAFRRSSLMASTRWPSRPTTVVAMVSALRMASSVASTVAVIKGFRCVSARCVC